VDLLPLARDPQNVKLPDRYLFWDLYGDIAALHGNWKLVGQISNHRGRFDKAAREAEGAKFALYNLEKDPRKRPMYRSSTRYLPRSQDAPFAMAAPVAN
jgi:hypothetical protein